MNDVVEEGDGDFEDSDFSDEGESDGGDSVDTEPCPYCGKAVFEQAERCPYCGCYISAEDSRGRRPLWVTAGVVITLVAIVMGWVLLRHY